MIPSSPGTLRRCTALFALTLAGLALVAGCADERGGYQHGGVDVSVAPPDAAVWDLSGIDLPAPPPVDVPGDTVGSDGVADGVADVPAAPDVPSPADVPLPPHDTNVPPPLARDCAVTFTYAGSATSVHVAGTFNEWSQSADPLSPDAGGWSLTRTDLAPGTYAYKLVVSPPPGGTDGWLFDPANPRRIFDDPDRDGCCWNSKLEVPDCSVPLLEVESLVADAAAGTVDAVILVRDGVGAPGIDAASVRATLHAGADRGATLTSHYAAAAGRLYLAVRGAAAPNKLSLRVTAANARGAAAPLVLPVWLEEEPFRWEDATLYFLFVDRFANGDRANDGPAPCNQGGVWDMADWRGGDWKGARQKIEAGWFDELGVTALWLTAPQDNPDGCSTGSIAGKLYSSYHGYHPKSQRDPENHFGTLEDFRALVDAAHARGIRVLVDAVVNHVHDEHPWKNEHPGWFNTPYVRCGSNDCDGSCWDNAPVTCWFEANLPDLNYEVDAAVEAVTDDLVWWVHETNLDGFRVDAVKHVEDSVLLELRAEIRERVETTGIPFYMVGETFTGGDQAGIDLLNRYIGRDMLDGQFDFPLFWDVRNAFATRSMGLDALANRRRQLADAYGPEALMSNFMGNHDVVRFLSIARGDVDDHTRPPAQPQSGDPGIDDLFGRMHLAFGFLLTIPGIPFVYYGDEVGMLGIGDPDNRRDMVFDGFAAPHQAALLRAVQALGQARRESVALRRGDLTVLEAATDHLAYARRAAGEAAVAALNRDGFSPWTPTLNVSALGWSDGTTVRDVLSGATFPVSGGTVSPRVPPASEGGTVVLLAD
jgi:glycosidase